MSESHMERYYFAFESEHLPNLNGASVVLHDQWLRDNNIDQFRRHYAEQFGPAYPFVYGAGFYLAAIAIDRALNARGDILEMPKQPDSQQMLIDLALADQAKYGKYNVVAHVSRSSDIYEHDRSLFEAIHEAYITRTKSYRLALMAGATHAYDALSIWFTLKNQ